MTHISFNKTNVSQSLKSVCSRPVKFTSRCQHLFGDGVLSLCWWTWRAALQPNTSSTRRERLTAAELITWTEIIWGSGPDKGRTAFSALHTATLFYLTCCDWCWFRQTSLFCCLQHLNLYLCVSVSRRNDRSLCEHHKDLWGSGLVPRGRWQRHTRVCGNWFWLATRDLWQFGAPNLILFFPLLCFHLVLLCWFLRRITPCSSKTLLPSPYLMSQGDGLHSLKNIFVKSLQSCWRIKEYFVLLNEERIKLVS